MKTGMDENYKLLKKKFYITFYEKIFLEAQIECNSQCTLDQFLDKVDEKFIAWLKFWDTGLTLYKGTENADGTYTWEKQ